jgi:hypothetical protein
VSARDVIADLGAAGISIWSEGARLIVEPASKLTHGLRERIKAHRPELLATLPARRATEAEESEIRDLVELIIGVQHADYDDAVAAALPNPGVHLEGLRATAADVKAGRFRRGATP